MPLRAEKKGPGYLRTWNRLLWFSSFSVNGPSVGGRQARRLEGSTHEPGQTAPCLVCQKQRDFNLAHSTPELTGKQRNSVIFFVCFFFKEREKERGEKLAKPQNSGNRSDRSYHCYEISLFHGQDCYISLAGQTEHHVSSMEASPLPRELDRGKRNVRKEMT